MGLAYKLRCLRSQTTTMGLLAGPSLNQAATEWLRSTRSGRSSHPVAEFQHGCSLATGTQARTDSWPSTRTSKSDRSTAEDPNIDPPNHCYGRHTIVRSRQPSAPAFRFDRSLVYSSLL